MAATSVWARRGCYLLSKTVDDEWVWVMSEDETPPHTRGAKAAALGCNAAEAGYPFRCLRLRMVYCAAVGQLPFYATSVIAEIDQFDKYACYDVAS